MVTCTLVGAHDQTKAAPTSGESPGERLSSRHHSRPEDKEQVQSLFANPEVWRHTVFLMMYDENDGYFDHVVP
ncbi:alkaline phosphatase family protein, partial [Streptomyces atratus]